MTALELKRLNVELMNVTVARHNQELRIAELMDQIDRVKETIKIQEAKETELADKIKNAEVK